MGKSLPFRNKVERLKTKIMKLLDYEIDIVSCYDEQPATDYLRELAIDTNDYIVLSLMFRHSGDFNRMDECLKFLESFGNSIKNGDHNNREDEFKFEFVDENIKYQILYVADCRHPEDKYDYKISLQGIVQTELSADVEAYLNFRCKEILNY